MGKKKKKHQKRLKLGDPKDGQKKSGGLDGSCHFADGTTNFVPRLRDKGDLLIGSMSRSHIFEVPGVDFINLLKADLSGKATKCHGKVEKPRFLANW